MDYLHSTSSMADKTKPTITVMWVRSSRTCHPNGDIKLGQNSSSLFLQTMNCSKCPLGPIKIGSYSPASLLCQRPLLGCLEDSSDSIQSDSIWVNRKSSSHPPLYHSLGLFWISNASNIHRVTWCKYLKETLDNLFSPIQSNHGCGQVVQFKDLDGRGEAKNRFHHYLRGRISQTLWKKVYFLQKSPLSVLLSIPVTLFPPLPSPWPFAMIQWYHSHFHERNRVSGP